jgi:hypothetical protein
VTYSEYYGHVVVYELDNHVFADAESAFVDGRDLGECIMDPSALCPASLGVGPGWVTRVVSLNLSGPGPSPYEFQSVHSDAGSAHLEVTNPWRGQWFAGSSHQISACYFTYYPVYSVLENHTENNAAFVLGNGQAPKLNMLTPQSVEQGSSGTLDISGERLTGQYPAEIHISGSGVNLSNPEYTFDGEHILVQYSVDAGAAVGDRDVTVSNPSGTSGVKKLTVTWHSTAPVIWGPWMVPPFDGARGTSGYIAIFGSDLGPNTEISIDRPGVTAIISYYGDPGTTPPYTQINIYVTVDSDAAAGAYNLTVTTPLGSASCPIITLQ